MLYKNDPLTGHPKNSNLFQSLSRGFRQSFPDEDSSEKGSEREAPVEKAGTVGSAHRSMELQHRELKKLTDVIL